MALGDFTRHQQGIIKRYYASSDSILLQKLGEQVTELYLAEGKKKEKMVSNCRHDWWCSITSRWNDYSGNYRYISH